MIESCGIVDRLRRKLGIGQGSRSLEAAPVSQPDIRVEEPPLLDQIAARVGQGDIRGLSRPLNLLHTILCDQLGGNRRVIEVAWDNWVMETTNGREPKNAISGSGSGFQNDLDKLASLGIDESYVFPLLGTSGITRIGISRDSEGSINFSVIEALNSEQKQILERKLDELRKPAQ